MLGKNKKTKKKKLKTTALPALRPFPRPSCLCSPGLDLPQLSAQGGEATRGWGAPGASSRSPLPQCRAGWGVRFIYVPLAHSSTYASPPPRPPCFCAFAHSPQPPGSGTDRGHLLWNQQGVPSWGPSSPPSQFHLHSPSVAVAWRQRW